LSELLAQHDKIFGKKKQVDEDVFLTVVSIQVKIQEEAVKEEETQIFNEDQTISREINQKDLKIAMINIEEVEILVRLYADDATKLVIMKNIVILQVIIYQILSNNQHMQSMLMIKMMMLQNMFLLHFKINNFRRFPLFS
jgi:hypothetical protein